MATSRNVFSDDEIDHDNKQAQRRSASPNVLEEAGRLEQQQQEEREPLIPRTIDDVERLSENYSRSDGNCKDDMQKELFDLRCDAFLINLQLSEEAIIWLERRTIGRRENRLWDVEQRQRLSDPVFGRVFRMRNREYRGPLVKSLLYPETTIPRNENREEAVTYTRFNEPNVVALYENYNPQIRVEPCGLFVHPLYGYLCASPHGLIGKRGILVIKCPYFAQKVLPAQIPQMKRNFYCYAGRNGRLVLRTKNKLYYQIQGQLEITGRDWCDLVIFTTCGISVQRIKRLKSVWDAMLPKLEAFYKQSQLPEMIDPRFPRELPIREPDFVVQANETRGNF